MKLIQYACVAFAVGQHNPPIWPSSVSVFSPDDSADHIESIVNSAYAMNGGVYPKSENGEFSDKRFAFLFKPGDYNVDVPVGYYTQVAGLGKHPSDVRFLSGKGVYGDEASHSVKTGALDTFWRSAENFQSHSTYPWWPGMTGMLWSVSQAAPLRRAIVTDNLVLFRYRPGEYDADFASGGYMSNSQVHGTVNSGSQQQWFTRNADMGSGGWSNGVWNQVFVGVKNAPQSHCGVLPWSGENPYITIDETPVVAEKPFITIDDAGLYSLNVPHVSFNRVGADFDAGDSRGFENVYVADDAHDTAESINTALKQGMDVVLSPGNYFLEASLELNKDGQVLLGLGLATLIASNGQAAIKVGNVDGVRVAGVLLEGGKLPTDALLQWGDGTYGGNPNDPGFLHDVFMRVGGPTRADDTQAKVMLQINSGNVVGDNLWLWRADHTIDGAPIYNGQNPVDHGLVVEGADVTMYGLASEHTLKDIVQWNADGGRVYFFQSELPYDVNQDFADNGYCGYRVADHVKTHIAYGVGVYHFFRDYPVVVPSGIKAPVDLEDSFVSPFGVYLNGLGRVNHVLNENGAATFHTPGTSGAQVTWLCPAVEVV